MSACQVCQSSTDAFLCRPCFREVERAIADMPALLAEVGTALTRQANVYRAARAPVAVEPMQDPEQHLPSMLRSRDGRIALTAFGLPLDLNSSLLLDDAANTLWTWARHLVESRGAVQPDPKQMLAWLVRNAETIRWDEAASEMHDELIYLHHQLERSVDRVPSRIYVGPCSTEQNESCCSRDLYAKPGAEAIRCDGHRSDEVGCGAEYSYAERQEWTLTAVNGALLPLEMWKTALPRMFPELAWPTRSTWYRWEQSGKLEVETVSDVGVSLYRGGQVIDVVVGEQPRIVGNTNKKRRCA